MTEDEENIDTQFTGELSPGHGMLLEGAAAGEQELVLNENIQNLIHTIRGVQVMLDSDIIRCAKRSLDRMVEIV